MSDTSAPPPLSRPVILFLVGVPLAWALLLLLHPKGDGTAIYADIHDQVTPMLVVHIGMLLFIPLMAVAIFLLLRGVEGTAAKLARFALVPFVVFYSAWETLQGIANGVLVLEVNGLPAAERATGAELIQRFAESPLVRDLGVFATLGTLGLIAAMLLTGVALHRHAGAPLAVAILLGFSGLLISAHPPPFGPAGLGLFIVAVLVLVRGQSALRPLAHGGGRPALT